RILRAGRRAVGGAYSAGVGALSVVATLADATLAVRSLAVRALAVRALAVTALAGTAFATPVNAAVAASVGAIVAARAQGELHDVAGRVRGAAGEAVAGAEVRVLGTTRVVVADGDGRFVVR